MLVLQIIHSVLDVGLVLYVLFALRREKVLELAHFNTLRELSHNLLVEISDMRASLKAHEVSMPTGARRRRAEIWKGDQLIGEREEGHRDIAEAEAHPALSVRWLEE